MKTKLLTLSAIFILVTFTVQAQIGFGILGGLNFQNLNGKDFVGDKLEYDMIPGFHGGVNVQIPVAQEFYFQPGVLFSTKGAKYVANSLTTTIRLSYVEVPLNLVYKGKLGNGFVILGFGPYLGFGIGGKVISEGGGTKIETDIIFQNTVESGDALYPPYFKRFDAGANIFAGYELAGGIFLQLNAQLGMLKINPEDNLTEPFYSDKSSVKNTGFGLSVGYRF
ncbi:MAG: PorT family protein [Bacteroidales bacterium]|nr:PorT family protein [Bacteroidales bacterium]